MSTLPSVMVVDDEEELSNLFKELLKGSGFNSVSFTDPLQAIEQLNSPEMYIIVITDLGMPEMEGLKLAKKLREYNPNVKILLIPGYYFTENFNSDDLREAQISNVIQKPDKVTQLKNYVNDICYNTTS